jgi:UDP-N-acetylglucosamine 3-dehydrogenase
MTRSIRIALIGAGEIGAVHARAHVAAPGNQLAAIYDVHPEQARRLAQETGSTVAPSLEAVLEDPRIEGVDLCVPNHLHRDLAVRALGAGKHVLCEKPIALSLEDADAMLAAAARANRFLMIGHVLRFWPEYVLAKQAIEDGRIGEVLLMSGRRMVSLLAGTPGADGWRRDPVRSGGAVLDMQIHDLDVFCWMLGRPESIAARGVRSADGAWSHVFTTVDFAGGHKAFVEASFMMQGNPLDIQFHIVGTTGSLAWKYTPGGFVLHGVRAEASSGGPSLVLYHWGKEPEGLYTPAEDVFAIAMRDQVACFADGIRSGTPPAKAPAADSRRALALALASRESCESGRPVTL